jgi:hypothetical protein
MGFVGELILDDKEVFVLTRKGFDEAGVVPGPKDVVAPPDWEKAYDEYRRIWWTRVAKEQHVLVRVRDEDLRMDGEDVATDPPIGWGRGDILLGETGKAAFAAQRPGQPFKWLSSYGTAADPFTRNEYAHVDELVADLLADGRHVTDLRRCVGVISDVDVALRCLGEGMVAQRAGYGVYLLHPRVDGVHGDLLELSRDVEKSLMDKKLIVRALAFRSDYHHEWLYALPDHALVAALAAQKDAGKAARKPDTSEVVGYDDDGQPVTMDEVTRESYRRAPEGATFAVLAPFGYPGGEEQFEIDQYVENIRLRRRQTKSASADKGDGFTFEDF